MRGGGTARLPILATNGAELKAEWDLKYVSGHGSINGRVFKVPENYYIFFVANAGEPSTKEETAEVLNFIYDYLNKEDK